MHALMHSRILRCIYLMNVRKQCECQGGKENTEILVCVCVCVCMCVWARVCVSVCVCVCVYMQPCISYVFTCFICLPVFSCLILCLILTPYVFIHMSFF